MKRIVQKFIPSNGKGEGYIMVLRDEIKEKKTDGGLYIAERAIELANQGEVRATYEDCQYEVGQRVVFTKYSGSEFELNGVLYLLLKEKEIQGKVVDCEIEISDENLARPQSDEDVAKAAAAALAILNAETSTSA